MYELTIITVHEYDFGIVSTKIIAALDLVFQNETKHKLYFYSLDYLSLRIEKGVVLFESDNVFQRVKIKKFKCHKG